MWTFVSTDRISLSYNCLASVFLCLCAPNLMMDGIISTCGSINMRKTSSSVVWMLRKSSKKWFPNAKYSHIRWNVSKKKKSTDMFKHLLQEVWEVSLRNWLIHPPSRFIWWRNALSTSTWWNLCWPSKDICSSIR